MRRVVWVVVVLVVLVAVVAGYVRWQQGQEEKAAFYEGLTTAYFAPYRTTDEDAAARVVDAFDTEGANPDPDPLDDPFFTSRFFLDARSNLYAEPFRMKRKALYDRTLADIEDGITLPGLRRSARFHVTEMYMESGADGYSRAPVLDQVLDACGKADAAPVPDARDIVEDFDPESDYDPDRGRNDELGEARAALASLVQRQVAPYC